MKTLKHFALVIAVAGAAATPNAQAFIDLEDLIPSPGIKTLPVPVPVPVPVPMPVPLPSISDIF